MPAIYDLPVDQLEDYKAKLENWLMGGEFERRGFRLHDHVYVFWTYKFLPVSKAIQSGVAIFRTDGETVLELPLSFRWNAIPQTILDLEDLLVRLEQAKIDRERFEAAQKAKARAKRTKKSSSVDEQ